MLKIVNVFEIIQLCNRGIQVTFDVLKMDIWWALQVDSTAHLYFLSSNSFMEDNFYRIADAAKFFFEVYQKSVALNIKQTDLN